MIQLILHLIGDYVTQSDYMAQNKTKRFCPAMLHAIVYSLPFLLLKPSWIAFAVILGTHFLIDRYRLARFVVYVKNVLLNPPLLGACFRGVDPADARLESEFQDLALTGKWSWDNCSGTGYPADAPPWLAVWLLIAADNTLHLLINWTALTYL